MGDLETNIFGQEFTEYILKHFEKESGGEIIKLERLIKQTDRYRFVCRVEKPSTDPYITKVSVEQAFYLSDSEITKMRRNKKLEDLGI